MPSEDIVVGGPPRQWTAMAVIWRDRHRRHIPITASHSEPRRQVGDNDEVVVGRHSSAMAAVSAKHPTSGRYGAQEGRRRVSSC